MDNKDNNTDRVYKLCQILAKIAYRRLKKMSLTKKSGK